MSTPIDNLARNFQNMATSSNITNDGLFCLSGDKPFFKIKLDECHVQDQFRLLMPPRGCKLLPNKCVPLVLMYDKKNGREHSTET